MLLDGYYTVRYNDCMDNRLKLLDCALDLFAARGFDAVGVQEIVDAAGVTKPTLYHYFGSKSGLMQSLLASNFAPLDEALTQAAAYHHDLTMNLRGIAGAYFKFAGERPMYYRMLLALWLAPRESEAHRLAADLNDRQQRCLEELFTQAAEDHGNMRGRQREYAATFLGLVNTCISLALNGHAQLDEQLVYRVIHRFEHGIYS